MDEESVMISVKEILEILNKEVNMEIITRDYFTMTGKEVYIAGAQDAAQKMKDAIVREIQQRYFPQTVTAPVEEVTLPTPPEGALQ
jgi:hypothetical protein